MPDQPTTVYFDGSCPLCRAEIALYRRQAKAEALCFADVSDPATPLGEDLERHQAMKRFHVRKEDGRLVSGAAAFVEVWKRLPQWRWAARATAIPGIVALLETAYQLFLAARPHLARLFTTLSLSARREEIRSDSQPVESKEAERKRDRLMKLLVIGASRGIGLEVVKQALSRGYEVRAFARSAESIGLSNPRLEKRDGSALKVNDMSSVMMGVDAVILTLGVPPGPSMVLGPVDLFSRATQIVIDAMKKARVKRLLCVTGFGAGDSRAKLGPLQAIFFQLLLGRAYDDKDVQETIVRRSGLDWIIVRPVILTNGPKTGRYKVLCAPKDWRSGTISRADVADFLLKQVQDRTYLGKTPVLTK